MAHKHNFVRADIRSEEIHEDIGKAIKSGAVDGIVVNFAAETHVDRSIYRSQDFVATNVIGTVN